MSISTLAIFSSLSTTGGLGVVLVVFQPDTKPRHPGVVNIQFDTGSGRLQESSLWLSPTRSRLTENRFMLLLPVETGSRDRFKVALLYRTREETVRRSRWLSPSQI